MATLNNLDVKSIPQIPFYMSQANQEFLGTPVGSISATMTAASAIGVTIPGLVSQFAGKSNIEGTLHILTLGKHPDQEYVGFSRNTPSYGYLNPAEIGGGGYAEDLYESLAPDGTYKIKYDSMDDWLPDARIYDVRTGAINFCVDITGTPAYGVNWIVNAVPDPTFSAWHDAYNTYGAGYKNELIIENGLTFIVRTPSSVIQAQGEEASYLLTEGFPVVDPYYYAFISQAENGVYTLLACDRGDAFRYKFTLMSSVNATVTYQSITDGTVFNMNAGDLKGIKVVSLDGVTTGTATFAFELVATNDTSQVLHSYSIVLESTP